MIDDQYLSQGVSSWDTKVLSTSFNPPRPAPNVSTIPMSTTTNYVVPYSKYNSSMISQNSVDGRQMQQYQQPSKSFQPTHINSNPINQSGFCAKLFTGNRVIGLLVGLILTGVPLAVIVTLFVLLPSSSNSSGSGSSSSNTTLNLPSQCTTYGTISDSYRVVTYTSCGPSTCDTFNNWYRISGAAGTQLATSPVSQSSCGSYYPAWFNGSLPTTPGTTTSGVGCVYYNGNICFSSYSTYPVLATNCNGFYVFYLPSLTCICCSCSYPRYCTV